jgi:hypothetical protein
MRQNMLWGPDVTGATIWLIGSILFVLASACIPA